MALYELAVNVAQGVTHGLQQDANALLLRPPLRKAKRPLQFLPSQQSRDDLTGAVLPSFHHHCLPRLHEVAFFEVADGVGLGDFQQVLVLDLNGHFVEETARQEEVVADGGGAQLWGEGGGREKDVEEQRLEEEQVDGCCPHQIALSRQVTEGGRDAGQFQFFEGEEGTGACVTAVPTVEVHPLCQDRLICRVGIRQPVYDHFEDGTHECHLLLPHLHLLPLLHSEGHLALDEEQSEEGTHLLPYTVSNFPRGAVVVLEELLEEDEPTALHTTAKPLQVYPEEDGICGSSPSPHVLLDTQHSELLVLDGVAKESAPAVMTGVGEEGGFGGVVGLNCRQAVLVLHEVGEGHGEGEGEVDGWLFLPSSIPQQLHEAVQSILTGTCEAALPSDLLLHLRYLLPRLMQLPVHQWPSPLHYLRTVWVLLALYSEPDQGITPFQPDFSCLLSGQTAVVGASGAFQMGFAGKDAYGGPGED